MAVDPSTVPLEPARLQRGIRFLTGAMNEFAEATGDYPRLLETVARKVAEVIGDGCVLLLLSDDGQALEPVAIHDTDPEVGKGLLALFDEPLTLDQPTMARDVMLSGEPLCIPLIDVDAFRKRTTPEAFALHQRIGTHGLLIVPLRVRGEPLGSLSVVRHREGHAALDAFDVELAHDLARHAALAISNARLMKRTQDELTRRIVAEQAALFLDAIVENIPDMVFVKDAEKLAFTRFNRAGEELLGIPRTELIGKSDLDFFPTEQAEAFVAKDRETLESRTLVDIPEEPIETAHGRRWLHTKKVPIVGADGTPRFLLGISQDITERKRADATLRTAKEAAETASRELEAFSYSVAHDLRAPLRAMDGFSQALVDDYAGSLDETGRAYLYRIRESSQRMARLIDELLALSRMSRAELRLQTVDLTALVRRSFARLQHAEPHRRVVLVVQEGLNARCDPGLLEVALDNLLANAWKFTSKQPATRIEVGSSPSPHGPAFFVRDDGVGFDMAYVHKLFGVFERLHALADFEGTGIGLATVQRIVTRHGGRVWAEGEVGHGATFYFTLPEGVPSQPQRT
ncbi:MAG: ATP-binding protein [Polyangiaceae bacterium]|jgi:PAS domain S-box-containing protein